MNDSNYTPDSDNNLIAVHLDMPNLCNPASMEVILLSELFTRALRSCEQLREASTLSDDASNYMDATGRIVGSGYDFHYLAIAPVKGIGPALKCVSEQLSRVGFLAIAHTAWFCQGEVMWRTDWPRPETVPFQDRLDELARTLTESENERRLRQFKMLSEQFNTLCATIKARAAVKPPQ